jgi:23S rRNA pseudouridine1911/1915/1917 synthase
MSVRSRNPREAISHATVLHRLDDPVAAATLVRVRPETGRTHQIRVHLATIGHPCLGDPLYGGSKGRDESGFARQALHALALAVDHPRTGERLEFIAPLPDDMRRFLVSRGVVPDAVVVRRWIDSE